MLKSTAASSALAAVNGRDRPAAGSRTIDADAAAIAVPDLLPKPPPLPPPPPIELRLSAETAGGGCPVVGCSEASSGSGHAAITVPLPQPPPLCSRALTLELAVSLSRRMAGSCANAPGSGKDGVQRSTAELQEQAPQQSPDEDAVEEGELLGELQDPLSGLSVQPTWPAHVPAEQAAGAGVAARPRVSVVPRPAKINGNGAVAELQRTPAPASETVADKRRGVPLTAVAQISQSAETAQQGDGRQSQSAAPLPAGTTPSPSVVAARAAAAAACVPTKHAAGSIDKLAAATAKQRAALQAAVQAAAAKAASCAPAAVTCMPQERTAAEQAALRAAAERETSLRQLDRQARLLVQVRAVCNSA